MTFPISKFEDIETPFYYYDLDLLRATIAEIKKECSDFKNVGIHYAVKANSNPEILQLIASAGFGADTVSGPEVERALRCGFEAGKIIMAGVGKTDREISLALDEGIGQLNVESAEELEVISDIAAKKGCVANVSLRINPEIDAHTHHYITTGLAENKFGIAMSRLERMLYRCIGDRNIRLKGLHFHIGSQITTPEPFIELCKRINAIQDSVEKSGIRLETINVGGGLGIDYENPDAAPMPDFRAYFAVFRDNLKLRDGQKLLFELGRSVVGQCGSLISRVTYVKKGVEKRFVILDAGMTDLIRPALYGAHHFIQNLTSTSNDTELYDVVGPVCESSDTFATDVMLPVTHRGDLIALRSAGAYGQIMASGYNCRPLPKAVYSEGSNR